MKKGILISLLLSIAIVSDAQKEHKGENPSASQATNDAAKFGPKPYDKVISAKAVSKKGLFTVHKVGDKWYFEIPDSLFNREIMMTTRYSKTAGGGGVYAGEMENRQTIEWEKGPNKNVFLRVVTVISVADSATDIYKAVSNSNLNPIAGAFDIKAIGKDSNTVVIDVTDYFKGDNTPVSLGCC